MKNTVHCYNNRIVTCKTDEQLGVPLGHNDRITFGRFKGAPMGSLPGWYLRSLWRSKRATQSVLAYIEENLHTILIRK